MYLEKIMIGKLFRDKKVMIKRDIEKVVLNKIRHGKKYREKICEIMNFRSYYAMGGHPRENFFKNFFWK
jgi:hypothetical protein